MWHIVEQLYKELGHWCGTIIERHSQKCKPWAKPPNNRSNGFIIAPIELRTGFPNCSMYAEEQNCCILRRLQWSHSEPIVIILFNFVNIFFGYLTSKWMLWKSNFILGKPNFFGHGSKGEIQHICSEKLFFFQSKKFSQNKINWISKTSIWNSELGFSEQTIVILITVCRSAWCYLPLFLH